jgi:polyisoprenoid-binding protein YceI
LAHRFPFSSKTMTNRTSILSPAALALGLLWASAPAWAQQKLVPAQSSMAFTIKQMGVPVDGQFKKFDAQLSFDPAKLATSKIAFTIDMGSATMGAPESDAEMPKAVWFNAVKFPQATFQSSAIKALGGGKFEVAGQLNIKGNVRDVVVPVALAQSGTATTATGAFAIKRLAFKVGEGEWADTSMVADEVQVKFKLALTGVGKL